MAAVLVVGIFAFTSAIPTEVNTSIVNNDSSVPVNNILPSAMADGADDDEDDEMMMKDVLQIVVPLPVAFKQSMRR